MSTCHERAEMAAPEYSAPSDAKPTKQHDLPLVTVDWSDNMVVMQVSTMLRRAWLLDPITLTSSTNESLAEDGPALSSVMQTIGNGIAVAPPETRWDDGIWRSETGYGILDPPCSLQCDETNPRNVWSPWRESVYHMHNHVFIDVWRRLRDDMPKAEIGQFRPPNVGTWALEYQPKEHGSELPSRTFSVDTFVCPVWLDGGVNVHIGPSEAEQPVIFDARHWTSAVWVRAGEEVTFGIQGGHGANVGGIAAVLVLGYCEPSNVAVHEEDAVPGGDAAHEDAGEPLKAAVAYVLPESVQSTEEQEGVSSETYVDSKNAREEDGLEVVQTQCEKTMGHGAQEDNGPMEQDGTYEIANDDSSVATVPGRIVEQHMTMEKDGNQYKRDFEGKWVLVNEDDDRPLARPEADHLARAIFLKGGDVVDRCTFDEAITKVEDLDAKQEPPLALPLLTTEGSSEVSLPLYERISNSQGFRVLVLEPGGAGDDLRTSLRSAKLDDAPAYEAISYTWGDPKDKTALVCNDTKVLVPQNLIHALERLRRPHARRILWADAVCINQQDLDERGQQVSIMRPIFQSAERVLVWLGNDDARQAEEAFGAICDIVRSWRPANNKHKFMSYGGALEPVEADSKDTLPIIGTRSWASLKAMFEAAYFQRFWVIQELAVPDSAVIFWGEHHIAWPLIGISAAWLLTRGWNFGLNRTAPITAAYNALLIYVLPLAKHSGISRFSKLDLTVVLGTTTERFASTDAKDRIYALLGLPFSGNDPSASLLVQPNYGQNLRLVYIDAARRMLQKDKHLRLLSAVQHGPPINTTYPSWVPKWNESPYAEPMGFRGEHGYYANAGELFFPSDETFGADGETLVLIGLEHATVTATSEELRKGNLTPLALGREQDQRAWATIIDQLNDEAKQFRASWSATLERFTLFGFSNPEKQATTPFNAAATTGIPGNYTFRAFSEILDGERAQADHLGEFLLYWRERIAWNASELRHEDLANWWAHKARDPYAFERALCSFNTLPGRRIFHCENGNSGLGPAAMRPGDVVAILFGGVVPYILRPIGGQCWRFVGECFVPELMQGEAVEAAGLLKGTGYSRSEDGSLRLEPRSGEDGDPRYGRVVGEQGVRRFVIR